MDIIAFYTNRKVQSNYNFLVELVLFIIRFLFLYSNAQVQDLIYTCSYLLFQIFYVMN